MNDQQRNLHCLNALGIGSKKQRFYEFVMKR